MLDMIRELEITCVAITETWFKGGAQLRQELGDVEQATGIKIICKNRASMKGTTRGGGVALAFNTMTWNFKERAIKNKGKHELLCAVGPIGKITRKVVIFGLYIPPKTTAARMSDLCDTLGEAIAGVKVALGNPILYVAGDINGHNIEPAFDVDPDITLLPTPPTRGTSTLDLVFANIPDLVDYAEVRPPLETEQGIPSDHGCVHVEATIPKQKNFVWMKKTTRKRSDSADERFAHDLDQTIWDFTPAEAPDAMVQKFEQKIAALTDVHFPLRSTRVRSNEDPWITNGIRRRAKRKKRLYKRTGRSEAWKRADERLEREVAQKKQEFVDALVDAPDKSYYAAIKKLSGPTAKKPWEVTELFPDVDLGTARAEVLDYIASVGGVRGTEPMAQHPLGW